MWQKAQKFTYANKVTIKKIDHQPLSSGFYPDTQKVAHCYLCSMTSF